MAFSIQTNVNSLMAQENLRVNGDFQSRTIQRLTSGYRINSSGDDAAGLAVANDFRSKTSELTQGIRNANDAISQLQIIDSGANNITKIMDRLKTLATQSASNAFTGDRSVLNNEFSTLLTEVDRQAKNINLDASGSLKTIMQAYIGGAGGANSNAKVSVDLSSSAIDSTSLKLNGTSIVGGGTGFGSNNAVRLDDSLSKFVTAGSDTFSISYVDGAGAAQTATLTVSSANAPAGSGNGYSGQEYVDQVNKQLAASGVSNVSALIGGDGKLAFTGSSSFAVTLTGNGTGTGVTSTATTPVINTGLSNVASGAFAAFASGAGGGATSYTNENFTVSNGTKAYSVALTSDSTSGNYTGTTIDTTITAINKQLNGSGVTAIKQDSTHISFQSGSAFTVNETTYGLGAGAGAAGSVFGSTGSKAVTAGVSDATLTGNALKAIDSITSALKTLGAVQGRVGTGQNQLQYAISLAQSQVSNYSAAESRIRDADVASEAANLTKAQVLQQASLAAMAQANSAPQAILALLRG